MTQSLLLGGVSTGIATALEIEGGFFDRLVSSPVPRLALVLGRLVAAAIISAAQIVYFLVVGLVFGASIAGGIPGALVVLLIGVVAGDRLRRDRPGHRAAGAQRLDGAGDLPARLRDPVRLERVLPHGPARVAAGRRGPLQPALVRRRRHARADHRGRRGGRVLEGLAAAAAIAVVATGISVLALRGKLGAA
jgi:ABC-2 type transport system permease protein